MVISAKTWGGVTKLDVTPLEKVTMLVILAEAKHEEWLIKKDSHIFVGCSRKTLYRGIKKLIARGIVRKLRRGTYSFNLKTQPAPINFKYYKKIYKMKLPCNEKLLLLSIASFIHSGTNYTWVRRETLQKITGFPTRTFYKTLSNLKKKGIVKLQLIAQKPVFLLLLDRVKSAQVSVKSAQDNVKSAQVSVKSAQESKKKTAETLLNTGVTADLKSSEHTLNTFLTPFEHVLYEYKTGEPIIFKSLPAEEKEKYMAEGNMIKKYKTAEEIITLVKEKKKKISGKPGKQLKIIWQEMLPKLYELDSMSQIHITGKIQGQLNHLANYWKKDSVAIFKNVLNNWNDYMVYIKTTAGLNKVPKIPQIGFMVKYTIPIQVYYMKLSAEGTQKQVFTPQPIQSQGGKDWKAIEAKILAQEEKED